MKKYDHLAELLRANRGKAPAATPASEQPAPEKRPKASKAPKTPPATTASSPEAPGAAPNIDLRAPEDRKRGKPRDGSKNPGGRPEEWSDAEKQAAVEIICTTLAGGAKSVARAINDLKKEQEKHPVKLPSRSLFFIWLSESAKFMDQYARAKAAQVEGLLDEAVEIADNETDQGTVEGDDSVATKFGEIPNKEWIMRSKLRVDTRLRAAELYAPKKYGKKVDLNHQGEVGIISRYHKPDRKKLEG